MAFFNGVLQWPPHPREFGHHIRASSSMATTSARVLQCRPHPRVLLLHLRVAFAVFADSPKEQGLNQSPLRRFADSPIVFFIDSSSQIRDLSAKKTSQRRPHCIVFDFFFFIFFIRSVFFIVASRPPYSKRSRSATATPLLPLPPITGPF
ncbi:hypothetical protein Syun_017176 [Stephania yunnanensis]|uniref:Uncharacterized protein n=1 Tax=Stephania yunnanensis TaxID=152371 RepID=A0AAP0P339_9MAGN